jgi:hypothetical protein
LGQSAAAIKRSRAGQLIITFSSLHFEVETFDVAEFCLLYGKAALYEAALKVSYAKPLFYPEKGRYDHFVRARPSADGISPPVISTI